MPQSTAEPSVTERARNSFLNSVRQSLSGYVLPLAIIVIFFLMFQLSRFVLFFVHRDDFLQLSWAQIFWAAVRGLRFDASIIFTVIGVPIILLLLPVRHPRWVLGRSLCAWVCFAALVALGLLLGIDIVYFGHAHRHIGSEVTMMREAIEQIAFSALLQYVPEILGFLALCAVGIWLWRRLIRASATIPCTHIGCRLFVTVFVALLMWAAVKGSITGKRIKIINALVGVSPSAGYLALNGPFCALHSMGTQPAQNVDFYPWEEALGSVQKTFFTPEECVNNSDYPMLRSAARVVDRIEPPLNVILVMLESWDATQMDCIRVQNGLPPLGMTPCFDRLAKEGMLFSRFYALGQRSMDGMAALLCGFPSLPYLPYIGRGLEQSRLTGLASLARQEGYETFFIQNSKRESFRADVISDVTGFQHYLGGEDIPVTEYAPGPGIFDRRVPWDHDLYKEVDRQLRTARQPFLGFVFTASTHHPHCWPDERFQKFPPDSREHRYLNSLFYADWALGQFIEAAKASGYYDRTIFVFSADHVSGHGATISNPPSLFHIPGLVIAPGLKPAVDPHVRSQLDVIPTIAELAGWSAPHAAFGRSLLSPPRAGDGALGISGALTVRIEEDAWLIHDLKMRNASSGKEIEVLERRHLSLLQVAGTLYRRNRVYP